MFDPLCEVGVELGPDGVADERAPVGPGRQRDAAGKGEAVQDPLRLGVARPQLEVALTGEVTERLERRLDLHGGCLQLVQDLRARLAQQVLAGVFGDRQGVLPAQQEVRQGLGADRGQSRSPSPSAGALTVPRRRRKLRTLLRRVPRAAAEGTAACVDEPGKLTVTGKAAFGKTALVNAPSNGRLGVADDVLAVGESDGLAGLCDAVAGEYALDGSARGLPGQQRPVVRIDAAGVGEQRDRLSGVVQVLDVLKLPVLPRVSTAVGSAEWAYTVLL